MKINTPIYFKRVPDNRLGMVKNTNHVKVFPPTNCVSQIFCKLVSVFNFIVAPFLKGNHIHQNLVYHIQIKSIICKLQLITLSMETLRV